MVQSGTVNTVSTVSTVETVITVVIILQYILIQGRRRRSYLLGFYLNNLSLTATALLQVSLNIRMTLKGTGTESVSTVFVLTFSYWKSDCNGPMQSDLYWLG